MIFSRHQLGHELSASAARCSGFPVRHDRQHTLDLMLPVRDHVEHRVSLCADSKRAGGVYAYACVNPPARGFYRSCHAADIDSFRDLSGILHRPRRLIKRAPNRFHVSFLRQISIDWDDRSIHVHFFSFPAYRESNSARLRYDFLTKNQPARPKIRAVTPRR